MKKVIKLMHLYLISVRQLKNDELVSDQRVENLTQYIQNREKKSRESQQFGTSKVCKIKPKRQQVGC